MKFSFKVTKLCSYSISFILNGEGRQTLSYVENTKNSNENLSEACIFGVTSTQKAHRAQSNTFEWSVFVIFLLDTFFFVQLKQATNNS